MNTKTFMMIFAATISISGSNCWGSSNQQALGGHVGGGDARASDLQNFINRIDTYLLTDEGKSEFPEIKQPDFHNMVKEVRPVVKNERVKDEFGINQTCISNATEGNRYIQCDLKRLPKLELNNQPTLYRIIFHELLFQAGLEKPISKEIPSDFRISSRLKLHLKKRQEWVVGETKEYPDENSSEEKRVSLNYQATLHFGIDYHASTTQVAFSKFLNSDSLIGLRFGARASNMENQSNVTFQYKRFTDNSFYYAPEVYYLNYQEKYDSRKDYELTGMGLGIRLGNQWQWDNFTLGCDWIGIGRTLVHFKSTASDKNFYTVTLANVYLGWSF